MNKIKIVIVNSNYCDYLRKFDNRIFDNHKKERPYVGVLFNINDIEYFAPLSSPKEKHKLMKNSIDFHKIENVFSDYGIKQRQIIGVINFNNMIPLKKQNYEVINLTKKGKTLVETKYYNLLFLDFLFIRANYKILQQKAYNIYNKYINNKLSDKVYNRCCNFKLLEEKCIEYNSKETVALKS